MRKVSACETKDWIKNIKSRGIIDFAFDDLKKYGLNEKKFLMKAISLGLVRKNGTKTKTNTTPICKWVIVDDHHTIDKTKDLTDMQKMLVKFGDVERKERKMET